MQADYIETINAIEFLPPSGDGAKDQAKKELKQAYDKYVQSIKAIQKHVEDKYL